MTQGHKVKDPELYLRAFVSSWFQAAFSARKKNRGPTNGSSFDLEVFSRFIGKTRNDWCYLVERRSVSAGLTDSAICDPFSPGVSFAAGCRPTWSFRKADPAVERLFGINEMRVR